mgnify:CR=1 FL=1
MSQYRPENEAMMTYLAGNGIRAKAKFLWDGSLKGTWRLSNLAVKWYENEELISKLNNLGFKDFDGTLLDKFSGNGGVFQIFARKPVKWEGHQIAEIV